jgi:hypothetical protein
MWHLTWETLKTAFREPISLIKCFYPVLAYGALMLAAIGTLSFWLAEADIFEKAGATQVVLLLVFFFVFISMAVALTVSACAVRWHRYLILGEPLSWRFPMLQRRSWKYAFRLALFLLGYIFIYTSLIFVWHGYLAAYLFGAPGERVDGYFSWTLFVSRLPNPISHFLLFFGHTIATLLFLVLFVLTLGRWMLVLPEVAADEKNQHGWTAGQDVRLPSFLATLYLFYSVPIVISDIASYLANRWEVYHGIDNSRQFAVHAPLAIAAPIATLSLLTVTYINNRSVAMTGAAV